MSSKKTNLTYGLRKDDSYINYTIKCNDKKNNYVDFDTPINPIPNLPVEQIRERTARLEENETLELFIDGIKEKAEDSKYYLNLSEIATSPTDKEILRQISLDIYKHLKIFEEIYFRLTGNMPPETEVMPVEVGENLLKEYEKAMFNELSNAEFTRKILFVFNDMEIRDMLYEIITDEQSNATKFLYLYTSNL